MRTLVLILSLFLSVFAWGKIIQLNCKSSQIKYAHQQLILNAAAVKQPQIYVFENRFNAPILLNHEKYPPGASAGWASKLNPQNASALMLMPDKHKFMMTCSVYDSNRTLDCAKVLKVCVVKNIPSEKIKTVGDFWVVENMPMNRVLDTINKKFNAL